MVGLVEIDYSIVAELPLKLFLESSKVLLIFFHLINIPSIIDVYVNRVVVLIIDKPLEVCIGVISG